MEFKMLCESISEPGYYWLLKLSRIPEYKLWVGKKCTISTKVLWMCWVIALMCEEKLINPSATIAAFDVSVEHMTCLFIQITKPPSYSTLEGPSITNQESLSCFDFRSHWTAICSASNACDVDFHESFQQWGLLKPTWWARDAQTFENLEKYNRDDNKSIWPRRLQDGET